MQRLQYEAPPQPALTQSIPISLIFLAMNKLSLILHNPFQLRDATVRDLSPPLLEALGGFTCQKEFLLQDTTPPLPNLPTPSWLRLNPGNPMVPSGLCHDFYYKSGPGGCWTVPRAACLKQDP